MWQIPRYTVNSVFMTGFRDQSYVRVFRIVLLVMQDYNVLIWNLFQTM